MTLNYNRSFLRPYRRRLRNEMTDAERLLWRVLRNHQLEGMRFLRQFSVGSYILDFYCPQQHLGIELDGGQHAEEMIQEHDEERTEFLFKNHIRVLRFWNNEVLCNIEGVVEKIREVLLRNPS